MRTVHAPALPVFRIATIRGGGADEVYDPPPLSTSFRGRFDDQRINDPNRTFPKKHCYRVLYFATERAGAFGEILQRHIPNPQALQDIFRNRPPSDPLLLGGQVKQAELTRRQIGATRLDPTLRFADVIAPESRMELYYTPSITPLVEQLDLNFLDVSAITGDTKEHRQLTQAIALHIYNLTDDQSQPLFDGIRYLSHVNMDWECWAVFHDRFRHTPVSTEPVDLGDPELHRALSAINVKVMP
ncbi:MAG TPA: RES domain-containing protein [Chloroflexia bacterium]|nr:RES domain-containing protein [Chloroflexia bacterium]